MTAVRLILLIFFPRADFSDGPRQIAVPFQRVHTQIKVGVKNKHGINRCLNKKGCAAAERVQMVICRARPVIGQHSPATPAVTVTA